MIAVSNTSPLRYLVTIGHIELVPKLFRQVIIPQAVVDELTNRSTPPAVRHWMERRPDWLIAQTIAAPLAVDLASQLDRGEAEAIQLALSVRPDSVLIDELLGRRAALHRGLSAIGTLGIVLLAFQNGLISDPFEPVQLLLSARFRISSKLLTDFIRQAELIRSSRH